MRTPEAFSAALSARGDLPIRSVLLYGSSAAGDHVRNRSDYNILVLLDRLDANILRALAPVVRRWTRRGNPAPVVMTVEEWKRSADVFPIEIADMRDFHQVLAGEDATQGLRIQRPHLRLQLERELRTHLLALRSQYSLVAGRPRAVLNLMLSSLSSFLSLFRGALRLFQDTVPNHKIRAIPLLVSYLGLPESITSVLQEVSDLKEGRRRISSHAVEKLFAGYLEALEKLTAAIDKVVVSEEST